MNMIMIALRDGRCASDLLMVLTAAGAQSATVLDHDGVHTLFLRGVRAELEGAADLAGSSTTILAVVPDALTEAALAAAEEALVGLSAMVCAWNIGHAVSFQGETRASELVGRSA